MRDWLLTRLCWILAIFASGAQAVNAAETLTAMNMITADAALCLEVPHLDQTWKQVDSSSLMQRVRALPAYKRLVESSGFRNWQEIEEKVAAQTGSKISSQLRALFGNSLVLAIYFPANGQPQGILVGEAIDAAAVNTALSTWNLLEPHNVVTTKTFQGHKYQQRRKGDSPEHLFYVASERWFAISDQETLIQDVIQRFVALSKSNGRPPAVASLNETRQFQQNRQRLKSDACAYLYISARPWDRDLEEASRDENGPINPAKIWKRVRSVTASLNLQQGCICDAVVDLDSSQQPSDWPQFVATAAKETAWESRIPSDVLMAVSGHLELASLMNKLLSQTPVHEKAELAKNRRIAQSLLGGNELFAEVLPVLSKDFCGSICLSQSDSKKQCLLDGTISFTFDSPGDAKLLNDVAHGLETGLSVLAAFFSVDSQRVVTVQHEQNGAVRLSWLSDAAPFPVAYGIKQQTLVIAGSQERLRKTLDLTEKSDPPSRLMDHSKRYFPRSNQLVWLDTVLIRQALAKSGHELALQWSHGSADEAKRFENRFEQAQAYLGLMDSLFIAGRIEADTIRLTFGGALDVK